MRLRNYGLALIVAGLTGIGVSSYYAGRHPEAAYSSVGAYLASWGVAAAGAYVTSRRSE